MGFSLRSFFGKGGSGRGTAEAQVDNTSQPVNMNVPASPFQAAPSSGESPFASSLMFKTNCNPGPLGQPGTAAPFNPFVAPGFGGQAELTVADILPGLPSDVAKNPEHSLQQTIVLPETVLESAMRSGRGAVPIFELYRVCPALFQMPVSPHDPREVPLPPGKIAQLLSAKNSSTSAGSPLETSAVPANASPFGFGAHLAAAQQTPGLPVSPFGIASAMPVEPIYQPSPFSVAASQPEASFTAAVPRPSEPPTASPFSFPAPPSAEGNPGSANPFPPPPAAPSSPFSFASAAPAEPQVPAASVPQSGNSFGFSPSADTSPVMQPSAKVTEAKSDGFFGQKFFSPETANPEPPMFGSPVESKKQPANESPGGGFLAEPPAASPATPVIFGAGASAEMGNAFTSLFSEQNAAAPLPPVPAMGSETGKSPHMAPPVENSPRVTLAPSANPFARIQALAKSKDTPAATPATFTPSAMPEPASFGSAFLNTAPSNVSATPDTMSGQASPSIFESLGLPTLGAPTPESGNVKAIVTPAANEPEIIKLGLAASLKNCATDDLGTSPEHIPSWVQFSLSVASIRSQLATGRVTVPFTIILDGLEPEVRGIFSKARAGLMVELASNEVFHALTNGSQPDEAPADFMPEAPAEEAAAPKLDPFAPLPPQNQWMEAPVAKEAESRFWADLPTAAIPSTLFTLAQTEPGAPEAHKDDQSEEISHEAVSEIQEAVLIPANPVTGAPEFTSVAPLPPRGEPKQSTPARGEDQTRRLMLAVLLGTSEVPDVGVFATLTRRLPGVSAVLCMHQDRVVASDGDETCEAERFLREAPLKMRMLPSLTALTGIEDTETLHIQSGQGEATFCLQGPVTLAVLHDPRRREPVLKEKITLLGRELAAFLNANPPA